MSGSVHGVAETGVEAVEGDIGVVDRDAGCGEGGFDDGVGSIRDWKEGKGAKTWLEISNDASTRKI